LLFNLDFASAGLAHVAEMRHNSECQEKELLETIESPYGHIE